jgi:murein DD-endopeptidase MepM/ murein hydrolase activator NlpD
MRTCVIFLIFVLFFCASCRGPNLPAVEAQKASEKPQEIPLAEGFDYPVGKTKTVTQKKDKDGWYNAQDFGANDHLGEDWNADTGGNTDCGLPVYSAARGLIVYAGDQLGWGNVLIVRHRLKDGKQVETLYGHLQEFAKTSGEVARREQIGKIGNGGGLYPCHLHFELRTQDCPIFGQVGGGYAKDRAGWLDPSDFIDKKIRTGETAIRVTYGARASLPALLFVFSCDQRLVFLSP